MKAVLATKNQGKVAELQRILTPYSVDLVAADYEPGPETGTSFAENAIAKAQEGVQHTGLPSLADDSGLTVLVMNGMPGIFSARWAGQHGDDQANLDLLLAQLNDVPDGIRGAAFVCAAAYALPDGRTHVVEGRMEGCIIRAPRGTNGFGYDPVFIPTGYDVTSAELSPEEKDAISHRGKAFRELAPLFAEALQT
ncbi:MAG: non-canonical purine pyrophosphatase, rdgB/HAM1 family [Frankiales bacterium]|nr:non-canonical purine pyrophosphatase, rdgB/HAM1 family [Frankiales bacterium]